MNFLAHAYLSGEDTEIITGNFIADRVKGKKWENYPPGIQHGILLHRFIDDFTDRHPVNLRSSRLLAPYFGKYSGVVMDVVNDHFLAINWEKHSKYSYEGFIDFTYQSIRKHEPHLPDDSKKIMKYMVSQDWLGSYRNLDEIAEVLKRMARRTSFKSGMDQAAEPLARHFDELLINFHEFFPALKASVDNQTRIIHHRIMRPGHKNE